jgi:hypothetical protein
MEKLQHVLLSSPCSIIATVFGSINPGSQSKTLARCLRWHGMGISAHPDSLAALKAGETPASLQLFGIAGLLTAAWSNRGRRLSTCRQRQVLAGGQGGGSLVLASFHCCDIQVHIFPLRMFPNSLIVLTGPGGDTV